MDRLEENVLHILLVIEHVTLLSLDPALLFVFLMDVSVHLEQSLTGRKMNVYIQENVKVYNVIITR